MEGAVLLLILYLQQTTQQATDYLPAVTRYGWGGALELYIMFLLGQALHIFRRASATIQSDSNPIDSLRGFVAKMWPALLVRGAFALVAFWAWINYPDAILKATGFDIALPVRGGTALLFGMVSDLILDWIGQKWPALGKIIPGLGNGEKKPTPATPSAVEAEVKKDG